MDFLRKTWFFLFDFDGVLADSNKLHLEVCRRVLREAGLCREVTDEELTSRFGKPYEVVLREVAGPDFPSDKLVAARPLQLQLLYSDEFMGKLKPAEGIFELLDALKAKEFLLGVASGNDRVFLAKALRTLGLDFFFDVVVSADDVVDSKPAPDMIVKAMDVVSASASETAYLGDSRNDVLAAQSAGVWSICVLSGILSLEEARGLEPALILDKAYDLLGLI